VNAKTSSRETELNMASGLNASNSNSTDQF